MSGVFGEILKKKILYFFSFLPCFDILDIVNAIFWTILVLEARNF